jgi:hypothetical protein
MVAVDRKELFGRWALGTWVAKVCKVHVPYIRRSLCAGRQQALTENKKNVALLLGQPLVSSIKQRFVIRARA